MSIRTSCQLSVRPLLFRGAVPRSYAPEISGRYDPESCVWVVELGGTRQPIVQAADEALLEIRTVTRITAESDDEEAFASRSATQCLELQTKTETQAESDDQCISTGTILELETKTSHNVEEDKADIDTFCDASASVPPSLIELMTKTDVQVER